MTDLDPRRLVFVVGAPRSGTTLLARMLGAHSAVFAPPELHLVSPLAHLGYFEHVTQAPYDPFQTARAHHTLVQALPGGEVDYVDAMRALTDTIYSRLLAGAGASHLVDKTPAYALVLPFLTALYPQATYVVLTRHPAAIWTSYARSFFDDDWQVAHDHHRVLERFIPAIAGFLRAPGPEHRVHLRYEDLVADPETALRAVCEAAALTFEPGMITYGQSEAPAAGLGDPVNVDRHDRPTTAHRASWVRDVASRPDGLERLQGMLRHVDDQDLEAWGFPRATLWVDLADAPEGSPRRPGRDRHYLERKALVAVRRQVRGTALGRGLKRARFALDVLLRE